jgi:uncharacterized membrane protein
MTTRKVPFAPRSVQQHALENLMLAAAVILGSLGLGIAGFHLLAGMAWIDAVLNSAMLLGGMGPVGDIQGTGGKLFASFYALYAGIVFLVLAALVLGPIFHNILHRFHLSTQAETKDAP